MLVIIKKEIDKIRSAEELLELIEKRKYYGKLYKTKKAL